MDTLGEYRALELLKWAGTSGRPSDAERYRRSSSVLVLLRAFADGAFVLVRATDGGAVSVSLSDISSSAEPSSLRWNDLRVRFSST